jgi:hypothetical protein
MFFSPKGHIHVAALEWTYGTNGRVGEKYQPKAKESQELARSRAIGPRDRGSIEDRR